MLTRFSLCLIALTSPLSAQMFEPGALVPSPLALAAPALEHFEYFGEGHPETIITVAPNDAGVLEVSVVETGFLDDSVAGGRSIYTIEYTAEGWQILTATFEQQCVRGDTQDWTTEVCP